MFKFFQNCFLILFILFCFDGLAQSETNHWYFGENAGMNFSNGNFSVSTDGDMITPAGCSSISDNNGDLLFYTNGRTIWNKNHQIMNNGDGLNGDVDGVQTSIIIPKPNDASTYYVFYTREFNVSSPITIPKGIYYSEVKFSVINPLGEVTIKNENIANTSTARLAVAYHYQSNSYRLICLTKSNPPEFFGQVVEETMVFRVFNILETGIDINPVIWTIEQELVSFGAMKLSPDNQFLVVADNALQKAYFYRFNNETVDFEFHLAYATVPAFGLFISPYGIEFSQDSKIFYYTGGNYIIQFPFTELGGLNPVDAYIINEPNVSSIQLARNGKIYIAKGDIENPSSKISVINKPEKIGVDCNFQTDGIDLLSGNSTKGLPVFVATFLRNRIIVSDEGCVNTTFDFSLDSYAPIDSVIWDFGDGTSSTDFEPSHAYLTAGTKQVSALIFTNNRYMTLYKDVEVSPLPQFGENNTLTQCDDNNDGFSVFNLENISDLLVFSNLDFQYTFFSDINDAINNTNQIQNQQNYINTSNPQEIFVKIVSHKGCSITTSFFIETTQTQIPAIAPIYVCENSDNIVGNNEGTFNLVIKEQEISNLLNVPDDFTINFYANLLDAQTKLNPLDRYYNSLTTTIWIRIEDENYNCFGVVSFNAIVNPEINLDIEERYTICESNETPLLLDGGNNTTWQWKKQFSSTVLSTNRFFEISETGNYNVIVTKENNGIICTESRIINIQNSEVPILKSVETDENGSIFVSLHGNGNYTYSINDSDYYGFGTYHTFSNLEPGIYDVFIKDLAGCQILKVKDILIFKIPKFFTPNQDGINDYWKIYGISNDNFSKLDIEIFDRYGRLLNVMNQNQNQLGWDGFFNKNKLPASDYWYKITLIDIKNTITIKKGHFSLIR